MNIRQLALLFLCCAKGALAVEQVTVTQKHALDGVSGAFSGTVDGKSFVFKSNGGGNLLHSSVRMVSGNVEGEYLAARMLKELGLESPSVRLVKVKGRSGLYSMSEFIGDRYENSRVFKNYLQEADLPAYPRLNPTKEKLRSYSQEFVQRLDVEQIRKLQLVDVLIGNGDRHSGNMFLRSVSSGKHRIIAIDHGFAFVTKNQKPDLTTHSDNAGWQRNFVKSYDGLAQLGSAMKQAGTVANIVERNCIYRICLMEAADQSAYQRTIREIVGKFSNDFIDGLLADLPEEIGSVRRQQIRDVLTWRRDNLSRAFAKYLTIRQGPLGKTNVQTYLRNKGVQCSSVMEEFIVEHLVQLRDGPCRQHSIRVVEGYYHLRAAGATRSQALNILSEAIVYLGGDKRAQLRLYKKEFASIDEKMRSFQGSKASLSKTVMKNLRLLFGKIKYAVLPLAKIQARQRLQHLDELYLRLDRHLRDGRGNQNKIIRRQGEILTEYISLLEKAEFIGGESLQRAKSELLLKRALVAKTPLLMRENVMKPRKRPLPRLVRVGRNVVGKSIHTLFAFLVAHLVTEQYHRGKVDIKAAIEMLNSPEVAIFLPLACLESKLIQSRAPAAEGLLRPLSKFIVTAVAFEFVSRFAAEATRGIGGESRPTFTKIMVRKEWRKQYISNLGRLLRDPLKRRQLLGQVFNERIVTCEFAMMCCGAIVGARLGMSVGLRVGSIGGPKGIGVGTVVGSIIGGAIGAVASSEVGRRIDISSRLSRLNDKRSKLALVLSEKGTGNLEKDYQKARNGLIFIQEYFKFRNETAKKLTNHYLNTVGRLAEGEANSEKEAKKEARRRRILKIFEDDLVLFENLLQNEDDSSGRELIVDLENDTFIAYEMIKAQVIDRFSSIEKQTLARADYEEPSVADLNMTGF